MNKRIKKLLATSLVCAGLMASSPIKANAVGWQMTWLGWAYEDANGNFADGWEYIDGNWYYFYRNTMYANCGLQVDDDYYEFDSEGRMKTGWDTNTTTENGRTISYSRYFHSDGRMARNENIDGYHIDYSGVWDKDTSFTSEDAVRRMEKEVPTPSYYPEGQNYYYTINPTIPMYVVDGEKAYFVSVHEPYRFEESSIIEGEIIGTYIVTKDKIVKV